MIHGATDEVGHRAADGIVTPNDFQATVLHLLGLDHAQLAYHANGRAQKLTDGRPSRVVGEILESRPGADPVSRSAARDVVLPG
jgi:hypothetical protein